MITGGDLYSVLCATAPLYFAMLLAYASVRWCHIFTPDQCSGINRFVAAFAVPVLSFHFISSSDPFSIDPRFLLADTLSKLLSLLLLSLSTLLLLRRRRRLDWLITLFSLATLPNTLVMGIPLLRAMYGPSTHHLMVQLLVLQCIVWYTLLLFLFEYRAAVLLVRRHFPGPTTAAGISAFDVDGDVISLDGRETILAESEDGRVRVRLSNLSGAEIYSANTPARPSPAAAGGSPRGSGYASSDAYSLQPTPRASDFNDAELGLGTPVWGWSPAGGGAAAWQASPAVLWEFHEGGKDDGGKDVSFRSTAKLAVRGDDDDEDGGGGGDDQAMPRTLIMLRLILLVVGRKLSRNPNTYSSVLGLVWSLVSFRWGISMPLLVTNSIKIISDAGLGMAMFSLGLFMALQPTIIACGAKMAILGMMIRFIGGPLIMSAASMAVGLRGARLHTAIVQAALPQGIVPFVFAREYGLHPDILSTAVIFGMLVSLPVTLLYYTLLGL